MINEREKIEAVRAWTTDRNGAGRYRNDETGLEREFHRVPFRGKWSMIKPRRIPLHVDGNIVRWWPARPLPEKDGKG